jgi:uncharacterized protein YggE
MRTIFLTCALVACSLAAFAQQAPFSDKPFIEVSATSETEVAPDEIYITVTLQDRVDGKNKVTLEEQEKQLKQLLQELKIDIGDITLNSADVDFRRIRARKKDAISTKSYVIKVPGSELLSKLYQRFDKMEVYDAFISRLDHSKILELQKDNRIKAIKMAKEKADYLLAAAGRSTGNPLQISEQEYYMPQPMFSNTRMEMKQDGMDGDLGNIDIKKIKIRSTFMVKYEIVGK